jgi:ribosomal protein S27E
VTEPDVYTTKCDGCGEEFVVFHDPPAKTGEPDAHVKN